MCAHSVLNGQLVQPERLGHALGLVGVGLEQPDPHEPGAPPARTSAMASPRLHRPGRRTPCRTGCCSRTGVRAVMPQPSGSRALSDHKSLRCSLVSLTVMRIRPIRMIRSTTTRPRKLSRRSSDAYGLRPRWSFQSLSFTLACESAGEPWVRLSDRGGSTMALRSACRSSAWSPPRTCPVAGGHDAVLRDSPPGR
jgi:hypothetical protein